jgi:hypothetical protein
MTADNSIEPRICTVEITGASQDYSSTGRRLAHWYRMVWRGAWQYVADRRLATGRCLASERKDSATGMVAIGEIVAKHDYGGPIDAVYVVVDPTTDPEGKKLRSIPWARRTDGQIAVTLGEQTVVVDDPRRRS